MTAVAWLFRLLFGRRLKWLAVGTIVRFLARRTTSRRVEAAVDQASHDIAERLPRPVARAVDAVPVDLTRTAGSAVVAGQAARRAAATSRRIGRASASGGRRVAGAVDRVRTIRTDLYDETERRRLELQDRYLRATEGPEAADEAWLEVRTRADAVTDTGTESVARSGPGGRSGNRHRADGPRSHPEDPLPALDEPVRAGRWRADRRSPRPLVGRVQRSYRRAPRRWDR